MKIQQKVNASENGGSDPNENFAEEDEVQEENSGRI